MNGRVLPVSVVVSVGSAIQPASVRKHAESKCCKTREYKCFAHLCSFMQIVAGSR
jgi:hypothetical protein